jgi:hypothetical protein
VVCPEVVSDAVVPRQGAYELEAGVWISRK